MTLTNNTSLYTALARTAALKSGSTASNSSSGSSTDFTQLFLTMMMTMNMNKNSDSDSGSGSSFGLDINTLIMPIMMNLLEKMQSQQLRGERTQAVGSAPTPAGTPVSGVLTQAYHSGHNGLDFGIVEGTEIKSTMDGKVIYSGWNTQGYGNLVIVENGDYQTYYAHLSSLNLQVGDTVRKGMTLGLSGNTGNSTGPHLHYEIRRNGIAIDPTRLTLNTETGMTV
ncbi:MAG TPA: M23 family metallopeptidase [Anaerolineaceae bacterium]|nr:M23 family metallopeptidase [Anaerolineaceae bacterium]HPN52551.1 M23 family metallopeptidase [Anaerolineaceae bacterium]